MYTHFYNFSEEPFKDAPDPKFLFLVPGQPNTLNCLTQGIEGKKRWTLLSGDAGCGKTVLIQHLLLSLTQKAGVKTAFIFQTRVSFEDLLKAILADLELPPVSPGGEGAEQHFRRCLARHFSGDDNLLIFLDEAQDFTSEVLEKIFGFFQGDLGWPGMVQIVLSGQPKLEEKLDGQGLRHFGEAVQVRCRIQPLTPLESRRYIDHRLNLVGGSSTVFSPQALNYIVRYGEGIPRMINLICDNSFRIGQEISAEKITAEIVRKAMAGLYAEKAPRPRSRMKKDGRPLWKKIGYPLAAFAVLFLAFWIGKGYLDTYWGQEGTLPGEIARKIQEEKTAAAPQSSERGRPKEPEPALPAQIPEKAPEKQREPAPPGPALIEPAKPPAPAKALVIVKWGDTLNSISAEQYGFTNLTLLDYILEANPDILNPNLIRVNSKIAIPQIQEGNLVHGKTGGNFQIFLGTFDSPNFEGTFRKEPLLKGKNISAIPRRADSGERWYRLWAETFADKKDALQTVQALRKKGVLPAFGGAPRYPR